MSFGKRLVLLVVSAICSAPECADRHPRSAWCDYFLGLNSRSDGSIFIFVRLKTIQQHFAIVKLKEICIQSITKVSRQVKCLILQVIQAAAKMTGHRADHAGTRMSLNYLDSSWMIPRQRAEHLVNSWAVPWFPAPFHCFKVIIYLSL